MIYLVISAIAWLLVLVLRAWLIHRLRRKARERMSEEAGSA